MWADSEVHCPLLLWLVADGCLGNYDPKDCEKNLTAGIYNCVVCRAPTGGKRHYKPVADVESLLLPTSGHDRLGMKVQLFNMHPHDHSCSLSVPSFHTPR